LTIEILGACVPTPRQEAKESGAKRYYTGKPCKYGHVCDRWVSDGACYECNLRKQKLKRDADPQAHKGRVQAWREDNRSGIADYNKAKYRANPDWHRARAVRYRKQNPEKVKAALKLWRARNMDSRREYVAANRHRYRAYAMGRNAQKINATPSWADFDVINSIYQAAIDLSKETGGAYHVDHIVPLQSEFVCGLHVQDNLQIIGASENMSKGNHWWPDMWT